jgi:ketosteroid isomerase-like protein
VHLIADRLASIAVSAHKDLVTKYFDGLRRLDREEMLTCLTEDVERVEWADGFSSSGVPIRGKAAFRDSISDPPGPGGLGIEVSRMTEEGNVVVVESMVRVPKKDGDFIHVKAWNVFEFEHGKIRRVDAMTVLAKGS